MIASAYQHDRVNRWQVPHGEVRGNGEVSGDLIPRIETCLESWRGIAYYISLARAKKFDAEDEDQFLELKGKIAQDLEIIWASGECTSPTKDEVHLMMNNVPSLRFISEVTDGTRRNLENHWHMIYIGWHATMGQIKVRHRQLEPHSHWTDIFRKMPSW
jgi:hypothetical protein